MKRTLLVSHSDRQFIPNYWKRRIRSVEALLQVEKCVCLLPRGQSKLSVTVSFRGAANSNVSFVYQLVLQVNVDLLKCDNKDDSWSIFLLKHLAYLTLHFYMPSTTGRLEIHQEERLIPPINTIAFHNMTIRSIYTKHKNIVRWLVLFYHHVRL